MPKNKKKFIFQLVLFHPSPVIAARFTVLTISLIIYIVLANYFGQQIIYKTEEVFQAAYYESNWSFLPPEIRRYILLIQNNSTQRQALTTGKMGEVSLEAAGIVISIPF